MVLTVNNVETPLSCPSSCVRGVHAARRPGLGGWLRAGGLATLMALTAHGAATAQSAPPCSIVLPQPRAEAEAAWWQVNLSLADQLASHLADQGRRVLRLQVPADAALPALVQALLEQSNRHGCDRIVESSVYAEDGDPPLIVARVRAYPVLREGAVSRIGEPVLTLRQEYPDTTRNRDRLTPAQLAQQFALEYAQLTPAAR